MIIINTLMPLNWPEAVEIHKVCFPDPWDLKSFNELFQQKGMEGWGAFNPENNELVGFCIFQKLFETIEIMTLCVIPKMQKKGVAMRILNALYKICAIESIDKVILEVRESNSVALSLYKKNGFEICHIRQNYYDNLENAILMTKKIIK